MLNTGRAFDLEAYQRANHSLNLGYRHGPSSDEYPEPDYTIKGDLCVSNSEAKVTTTHRKRVTVACERCRKRKIKCSGDQGDGRECDNCKSAGWEGCQFLRVRSELLQCHPTISASRGWHGPHYHPYSRSHRSTHHLQTSPAYVSSSGLTYPTWHNEVDYSGLSANTNNVSWTPQNYITPFPMYEAEDLSPYNTQPPSYMLPDPDQTYSHATYPINSLSGIQQSNSWSGQVNNSNPVRSSGRFTRSGYSIPSGSTSKPYALISLSTSFNTDRNVPNGSLPSTVSAIPSSIEDKSPISAVSHQSSHTWNTETTTSTGNLSSQTSCGDIHDISNGCRSATLEDQNVIYPYLAHRNSPQINTSATDLSISRDMPQSQLLLNSTDNLRSVPGVAYADADMSELHTIRSRENFRTTSPSLYGYVSRNKSLYYEAMPKKSMCETISYHWHSVPTSTSLQNDLALEEQQAENQTSTDMGLYPVTACATTSLIPSTTY